MTPNGAFSSTGRPPQMQPRGAPVIHINTETELVRGSVSYRRPDGDAPNDRYRIWEVPGGSHVSNDLRDPVLVIQLNDAELERVQPADLAPVGCTHQQFINGPAVGVPGVVDPNDFPFAFVANAAFHALTQWLESGKPPPHADFIEVNRATSPPSIVRDAMGNALGGVRTPFLDVPIATYAPFDTVSHTTVFSAFCFLYGYNVPFDQATLGSLYKNHGDYVMRFVHESAKLVDQGFWLQADAVAAIQRAVHADVR